MRRAAFVLTVAVLLLTIAGLAPADIIKLNTGGKVIGEIVEEDEWQIVVKTPGGHTVIDREDIASIERGGDLADLYKKRLRKINDSSARDHYELGLWCKENKLAAEYEKHMLCAIALAPGFDPPHEELGYVKHRGKWMTYEKACEARGWKKWEGRYYPPKDYEALEQGLVKVDGKWVSRKAVEVKRKARLRKIRRYEKAAEGVKIEEIKVPEDVQELLKMARDPDPAKRIAAYEALYSRGKLARDLLAKLLFQKRAKDRGKVTGYFKNNKSSVRRKLASLVEQRRKKALSVIFDKTIYPNANHGRSGQPKVDEVVKALQLVYETPFEYYLASSSMVQERWEKYKATVALVNKYTDAHLSLGEEQKEISRKVGEIIVMWKVMAPKGSFEVLAYNKKVKTTVNDQERACIDKTNWYRMMMGKRSVKIHEGLVQAARKHSECMVKNRFFSHGCKTHGSPAARCRREGAPYHSENIHWGSRSGVGAFWSWYHSSGHHRNILGGHVWIGVGQHKNHWTQDF